MPLFRGAGKKRGGFRKVQMQKRGEYGCGSDNREELIGQVIAEKNLKLPDVYVHCEQMAALSLAVKQHEGTPFCILPFDHLTEAEALGAEVYLGDKRTGLRGGNYICDKPAEILTLPSIDRSAGRIRQVLEACRILSGQGEEVLLEVSGPLTIMNALIDIGQILRTMRKDPEIMQKIFEKMRKELLGFLEEAAECGVRIISYADPVGGADILGPAGAQKLAKQFTAPFLREGENILGERMMMLLCPKTAKALLDSGEAYTVSRLLPQKPTYGAACVLMAGEMHFTGQMCTRNMGHPLKDGRIEEIKLI